jgi:hypothetical protein
MLLLPAMKATEAQLEQCIKWYHQLNKIGSDVGNLLLGRYIFRESQKVISRNPKLKGTIFARWLAVNYANTAALGIRWAIDTDRQAISLVNFLRDLIANPKVLTREICILPVTLKYDNLKPRTTLIQLMEEADLGHYNHFYTELAIPGSDHLNIRLIGHDLKLIQRKAAKVERFATKRLAHYDKIAPLPVRYVEIDEA